MRSHFLTRNGRRAALGSFRLGSDDRAEHRLELDAGFFEFGIGIGIDDDAAAREQAGPVPAISAQRNATAHSP